MRYFEWDPLQLSAEIDSGIRVAKQSISFDLFRTYQRKLSWTPLVYKNFGLFYGNLDSQKIAVVESMALQSKNFHQSVHIGLYTFSDTSVEELDVWDGLEEQYKSFFHHRFENNLQKFLSHMKDLRDNVEKQSSKFGMIEPSNKIIHCILLDLGEKELRELKLPHIRQMMMELLNDSSFQRFYIGLFSRSATDVPLNIHHSIDYAAYLGSENDKYCRDIHKDTDESEYSRQQILIGTAWLSNNETMFNIHPLKFTPNEAYIEVQKRLDDEDEAYMRFLNSLDDGTVKTDDDRTV